MNVPALPGRLPRPRTTILEADTILHRIHSSKYDGDAFNPCQGDATRFAPIFTADGICIPTLYGAASFDAAAYETVFRDIEPSSPIRAVPLLRITKVSHSRLRLAKDLRLASLFAPELIRLGLTRNELPAAPAAEYSATARWAEAIHRRAADVQGLVWTSNRCDPERVFVLFGDRVELNAFVVEQTSDAASETALLGAFRRAARRAGIYITL